MRLGVVVIGAGLLALGVSGCGGGKATPKTTTSSGVTSAGEKAAQAIRRRLVRAGYNDPDQASQEPGRKPRGQVAAYSVEVDFTSPDSYRLSIAVFDARSELKAYAANLKKQDQAGLARC